MSPVVPCFALLFQNILAEFARCHATDWELTIIAHRNREVTCYIKERHIYLWRGKTVPVNDKMI